MKIREKRTISKNVFNSPKSRRVTLHFNLRNPYVNRPSQLYAIIYIRYDGYAKQFKIPIGVKIMPYNWNFKKESITITGTEDIATIDYLLKKLTYINAIKLEFEKNKCIFALNNNNNNIINVIKHLVKNKDMANAENLQHKRGIAASTVVKKAFQEMYEHSEKKASTVKVNKYKLNSFLRFLKSGIVTDSAQHRLTVQGMNAYRDWLHKSNKELSKQHSYKHIEFIVSLVNFAIANSTKNLGINQIQMDGFSRGDVTRDNKLDNKHVEITEYELKKISELELDGKERDVRDLFLFACAIGCRYSDLLQITQKRFRISKDTEGNKMLIYRTQKGERKHITAYVPFSINPCIEKMLERLDNDDVWTTQYSSEFNKVIRNVFRKAELTRNIQWVDANGKKHVKQLCDMVTSHCCRVTSATQLLRRYGDMQFVVRTCGWTDDKMLREVYSRLTIDDEATLQFERAKKSNQTVKGTYDELADIKNAIIFLGGNYEDICDMTNISELYVELMRYQDELTKRGIDIKEIKNIYNTNGLSLKDRKKMLQEVCKKINNEHLSFTRPTS